MQNTAMKAHVNETEAALHILLVEDNEADIELTRIAFEENGMECRFAVARDGAEALAQLRSHAPDGLPSLILLDLNMPRMDGKQFLHELKKDIELQAIPVILLTSSHAHHDILDCYHLYANGYLVKPSSTTQRANMIRYVTKFLSSEATVMPPHEG